MLLIAASSASTVLLPLPSGKVVSYQPLRSAASPFQPFDTAFNRLDYNGGPEKPSNTDITLFWSPKRHTAYGSPGNSPDWAAST